MRRIINANPSMEEAIVAIDDREILSVEEIAINMDEAHGLAQSVHSDLNEIDRMDEVAASLLDLADVATGVDKATPEICRLIEISGDMAVAGTNIPAENLVPGMESYLGKTISVEGFKETARKIWESIQKIIKQIWQSITDFVKRIAGLRAVQKRHITKLKEQLSKLNEAPSKQEFELGIYSKVLEIKSPLQGGSGSMYVENGAELVKEADKYFAVIKELFEQQSELVLKNGDAVLKHIGTFDEAHPNIATGQLLIELQRNKIVHDFRSCKVISSVADKAMPRDDSYEYHSYETVLGNAHLVAVTASNKNGHGPDILPSLQHTGKSHLQFKSLVSHEAAKKSTMKVFSKNEMLAIVEIMDKLLAVADHFETERFRKLNQVHDNIATASTRLTEKLKDELVNHLTKKLADGSSGMSDVVAHYRALLNFNTYYAWWMNDSFIGAIRHTGSTISQILTIVDKSVACYAEPAKK